MATFCEIEDMIGDVISVDRPVDKEYIIISAFDSTGDETEFTSIELTLEKAQCLVNALNNAIAGNFIAAR